ncbi:MAG: hypothetical protein KDB86_00020 [Actinobacteria bacterium]|nr:hypothetical protein [Actinomycetota bacterium]MCB9388341.1 hypothetical protein [Acidimicrobiia bacterium]
MRLVDVDAVSEVVLCFDLGQCLPAAQDLEPAIAIAVSMLLMVALLV